MAPNVSSSASFTMMDVFRRDDARQRRHGSKSRRTERKTRKNSFFRSTQLPLLLLLLCWVSLMLNTILWKIFHEEEIESKPFAVPDPKYDLPSGGLHLVDANSHLLSDDIAKSSLFFEYVTLEEIKSPPFLPFKTHQRIIVHTLPYDTWVALVGKKTIIPVQKGDALLIGFWIRGGNIPDNGIHGAGVSAVFEVTFEENTVPYTKSVRYLVGTSSQEPGKWRHVWIRCAAADDLDVDQGTVAFHLGFVEQDFEIGGIEAWNFGNRTDLHDLPHDSLSYVGRERNASWREDAARRIEEHRKADISVTVVRHADSSPVAGVNVSVSLDQLEFRVGTAIREEFILGQEPDDVRYRQALRELSINTGVLENGLKFRHWDKGSPHSRNRTIQALHWLRDNNMRARGHALVWPAFKYQSDRVKKLRTNVTALRAAIYDHIREICTATKGLVQDWDVMNERVYHDGFTDLVGDEEMVRWFELTKSIDPDAELYINDYANLFQGGFYTDPKKRYKRHIRYLLDRHAPLDGLGIQGHFKYFPTPPQRLLNELDMMSAFGLKIHITEFDTSIVDEALAADFTRDFLTVCFSHPAVKGIITWGFWPKAHCDPQRSLYNENWELTSRGKAWTSIFNTWTTNENLVTDDRGQIHLRGFLGKYSLSAASTTHLFEHKKGGSNLVLRIP